MTTTSRSAFTQCVGYLITSVGPFGFGVLNGLTGGWTVPLLGSALWWWSRRSPGAWPFGRATWRTNCRRSPRWGRHGDGFRRSEASIIETVRSPTRWRWPPGPRLGR